MRPVPAHPARTDAPGHNPVRLSGALPLVTDLSLEDLEDGARRAIGEMAYAYYSGGAEDERLLQGNVEAWSHWQLHPHVLVGISESGVTPIKVYTEAEALINGIALPAGDPVDGTVIDAERSSGQNFMDVLRRMTVRV